MIAPAGDWYILQLQRALAGVMAKESFRRFVQKILAGQYMLEDVEHDVLIKHWQRMLEAESLAVPSEKELKRTVLNHARYLVRKDRRRRVLLLDTIAFNRAEWNTIDSYVGNEIDDDAMWRRLLWATMLFSEKPALARTYKMFIANNVWLDCRDAYPFMADALHLTPGTLYRYLSRIRTILDDTLPTSSLDTSCRDSFWRALQSEYDSLPTGVVNFGVRRLGPWCVRLDKAKANSEEYLEYLVDLCFSRDCERVVRQRMLNAACARCEEMHDYAADNLLYCMEQWDWSNQRHFGVDCAVAVERTYAQFLNTETDATRRNYILDRIDRTRRYLCGEEFDTWFTVM